MTRDSNKTQVLSATDQSAHIIHSEDQSRNRCNQTVTANKCMQQDAIDGLKHTDNLTNINFLIIRL